MGDRLGTPSAAGMSSDINAAWIQVASVKVGPSTSGIRYVMLVSYSGRASPIDSTNTSGELIIISTLGVKRH